MRTKATITVTLTLTGLLTGCSAPVDRVGDRTPVKQLTLSLADDLAAPSDEMKAWMSAVAKTSEGAITLDVHSDWEFGKGDFEKRTIEDVASGRADVGYVGARVFDTVGVDQFEPLLAPFLVDSLDLQATIFSQGIPQGLLASVRGAGVEGLAVLPGPMRTMLGVRRTFTRVGDFAGAVVGIQSSTVTEATFHALGATTRPLATEAPLDGVDGYEQQLSSIYSNHYDVSSKAVTGNLDFWPKTYVVIMNRKAYQRLSQAQRHELSAAATLAIPTAEKAARSEDEQALQGVCSTSLGLVRASAAELAQMRSAVRSVYAEIAQTPGNAALLTRIEALKAQQQVGSDTGECQAKKPSPAGPSLPPEGRYRSTLSHDESGCFPPDEHKYSELVFDLVLRDGHADLFERAGGPSATPQPALGPGENYRVFHDRFEFETTHYTLTWSFDGHRLIFSNPSNTSDCLGRELWTTHPWILQ